MKSWMDMLQHFSHVLNNDLKSWMFPLPTSLLPICSIEPSSSTSTYARLLGICVLLSGQKQPKKYNKRFSRENMNKGKVNLQLYIAGKSVKKIISFPLDSLDSNIM